MFADMGKHSTDKEGIHDSFMHTLLWYARAAPRVPPWGTAVAAAKASPRISGSSCMRRSPSAALEEDIVVKTLISRGVFDWGWKNDWDIRDIYQNCGLDNNLIEWTDVDFRDWGSFGVFSQGEQTRLKKELVKALCNPSGMQADLGAEVRQIEQTDPRVGLRGRF